jgi:hypothetical protein
MHIPSLKALFRGHRTLVRFPYGTHFYELTALLCVSPTNR